MRLATFKIGTEYFCLKVGIGSGLRIGISVAPKR